MTSTTAPGEFSLVYLVYNAITCLLTQDQQVEWPGPCTRPRSADALTRREIPPGPTDAGVKLVPPRPPVGVSRDGQVGAWRPAGAPA